LKLLRRHQFEAKIKLADEPAKHYEEGYRGHDRFNEARTVVSSEIAAFTTNHLRCDSMVSTTAMRL